MKSYNFFLQHSFVKLTGTQILLMEGALSNLEKYSPFLYLNYMRNPCENFQVSRPNGWSYSLSAYDTPPVSFFLHIHIESSSNIHSKDPKILSEF